MVICLFFMNHMYQNTNIRGLLKKVEAIFAMYEIKNYILFKS